MYLAWRGLVSDGEEEEGLEASSGARDRSVTD